MKIQIFITIIIFLFFIINCGNSQESDRDVLEITPVSTYCFTNNDCPCGSICLISINTCIFTECENSSTCPDKTLCVKNLNGIKTCGWKSCEEQFDAKEEEIEMTDTKKISDILEEDIFDQNNGFIDLADKDIPYECPMPKIFIQEGTQIIPQTILHTAGDQSLTTCGNIEKYAWKVEQPSDNKQLLFPSSNSADHSFTANVAGEYNFCLDICDSCGKCSYDPECATTVCKQVNVIPDETIHIELTWDTPADKDPYDEGPDSGTDLDLHFTHPYADSGFDGDGDNIPDPWYDFFYDCFWFNKEPVWGSYDPDIDDDPSFDREDMDGYGPEIINFNGPENEKKYKIGAHYWNDHGYGESLARIKIYIWQIRVYDVSCTMKNLDMWNVATIDWPSGEVIKVGDGCSITPEYTNPIFSDSY